MLNLQATPPEKSAYRKLTKQLIFMSLCQDIVNHRQSRYPRIYPAIIEKCFKNHTDHGAELAFAKIVRRNLPFLQGFFFYFQLNKSLNKT